MRSDLTDITVVLDRSGSMHRCRAEAEGGLNAFVQEQKEKSGECTFSLLEFDDKHEWAFKSTPIKDVGEYKLRPRGWTALLDAVGLAITTTGERLAEIDESQRPGLVTVVIVTDGEENCSSEYTLDQIKELVRTQTEKYSWQFTFLGANQDAFKQASQIGIAPAAVANYNVASSAAAFRGASANVSRMRSAAASGQHVNCSYSTSERTSMTSD